MTPFPDLSDLKDLKDLREGIPGASFGLIKIMVSALLGKNMIIKIHIYLTSKAEFT